MAEPARRAVILARSIGWTALAAFAATWFFTWSTGCISPCGDLTHAPVEAPVFPLFVGLTLVAATSCFWPVRPPVARLVYVAAIVVLLALTLLFQLFGDVQLPARLALASLAVAGIGVLGFMVPRSTVA